MKMKKTVFVLIGIILIMGSILTYKIMNTSNSLQTAKNSNSKYENVVVTKPEYSDSTINNSSSNNKNTTSNSSSNNKNTTSNSSSTNKNTASSSSSTNKNTASSSSSTNKNTANSSSSNNKNTANSSSSNNKNTASSSSSTNKNIANSSSSTNKNIANSSSSTSKNTANSSSSTNKNIANSSSSTNKKTASSSSSTNKNTANSLSSSNKNTTSSSSSNNKSTNTSDKNNSSGKLEYSVYVNSNIRNYFSGYGFKNIYVLDNGVVVIQTDLTTEYKQLTNPKVELRVYNGDKKLNYKMYVAGMNKEVNVDLIYEVRGGYLVYPEREYYKYNAILQSYAGSGVLNSSATKPIKDKIEDIKNNWTHLEPNRVLCISNITYWQQIDTITGTFEPNTRVTVATYKGITYMIIDGFKKNIIVQKYEF